MFVSFFGIIVSVILSVILYNKYFRERRYVKYGMISAGVLIALIALILVAFGGGF